MRKSVLVVFLFALFTGLFAQTEGDFRSASSGDWLVDATWEIYTSGAWAASSAPNDAAANVTILNGHTITYGATAIKVNNLTIDAGGLLYGTSNSKAIDVVNGVIQCDGTIASGASAQARKTMIQFTGNSTLQGSGSATIYRVRATTNSGSFTFNMDCVIEYGGVYINNKTGISFIVPEGNTLTLQRSYFGGSSDMTGSVSTDFTVTINGTVDFDDLDGTGSALNINNSAISTVNIGSTGVLNFNAYSALNSTAGSNVINNAGTINAVSALSIPEATTLSLTGNGKIVGSGSGTFTVATSLNAPSAVDVLGAKITSAADMGSTTVTVGFDPQTGGGNTGIGRYYDITPATNSGLNATLVFPYQESEIGSIAEEDLRMFKSEDGGTTWTMEGGIVDAGANTVTITGIDAFSRWTLADVNAQLPVELTSFTASSAEGKVNLSWATATEVNNYGFEIERKAEGTEFEVVGKIQGAGNSNTVRAYSFVDESISAGKYSYRLKQIDIDGKFSYSNILDVEVMPASFSLNQNYPNPFNPSTKISYSLATDSKVMLKVYNILGAEVLTLVNETQKAGAHTIQFNASNLPSGVYIYRLQADNFTATRKLTLLK